MKRYGMNGALVLGCLLSVLGCDAPQPVAQGETQKVKAPPAPPPPPGWKEPAPPAPAEAPTADPAQPTSSNAPSRAPALPVESKAGVFAGGLDELAAGPRSSGSGAAPAPPPQIEVVEAKKGVGLKGRSLDDYEGIVVTPAKTLFAAKERISFEIEVPHALNLYDAANGGPPRSHEEFMEGVIKANNIKLPQLPEGHEYWYDTQARQLMVKRPKMP